MNRRPWTAAEIEFLRARYADLPAAIIAATLGRGEASVTHQVRKLGLRKPREAIVQMSRERMTQGGHPWRQTQFKPGTKPWNAGRKGVATGGEATRFKPGNRPHTWVPVGSYTVRTDGTLERKVNDDPGPRHVRWKPVTWLVWTAAHGPVPPGHVVVFKPGRATTDPARVTPDALECITRRELMARNTFHQYGPEIARLVQLRGVLSRQINRKAKQEQEQQP